jgi:iron complex outermembrane receptor protein
VAATTTSSTASTTDATTSVQEVVVTARLRDESLQKVPVTDTAFNAQSLQAQMIQTQFDLQYFTPSLDTLTFESRNAGMTTALRGLLGVQAYFSEAPGGPLQAGQPIFDIQQIQVLNGPQSTLFGRANTAGAILVTPQHPIFGETSGYIDAFVGDYGRAQINGVINIPVGDNLAFRVGYYHDHIDGFTSIVGSSQKFDEINSDSVRAGMEFRSGHFDNYAVADFVSIDETPTSQILVAANPNFSLFHLPGILFSAVPSLGEPCVAAVTEGFSPSVAACDAQHAAVDNAIGPALSKALALYQAQGPRVTFGSSSLPLYEKLEHADFIDVAQYDFGDLGFSTLTVKNIFNVEGEHSAAVVAPDGIGGAAEISIDAAESSTTTSQLGQFATQAQQTGNQLAGNTGPWAMTYSDELRLEGSVRHGLLNWIVGGFYQDNPAVTDTTGVPNAYQLLGGVLTPNLGFNDGLPFETGGGDSHEAAVFAHGILDLSSLVHGLSLAGGVRYTDDSDVSVTAAALTCGVSIVSGAVVPCPPGAAIGNFIPGAVTRASQSSSGVTWTASLSEQFTPDLLGYVTSSTGYNPGGINVVSGANQAPNFTPTFSQQTVLDVEAGFKYDFQLGGMKGRLDADGYNMWYSNFQQTFTALVGGQSLVYTENVGSADLAGAEVSADLFPTDNLSISVKYAFADDHYTKWLAEDPFSQATVASPLCLKNPTLLAANICDLNLAHNKLPFSPDHSGSVTVRYTVPKIDPAEGKVIATLVVHAQSTEYLTSAAQRAIQISAAAAPAVTQPSYAVVNLRLDWEHIKGSKLNAALFVDNLNDATYATGSVFQLFSLGMATKTFAPPRMWGAELSYKFGP